jgi:hypothetical protein
MTPTPLNEELKVLAENNLPLNEAKMQKRIFQLQQMASFYEKKIEASPLTTHHFAGFVIALEYATNTIKMYRKLTASLAELTKEKQ